MSLEFTYNSLSKAPQGLLLNMAIMLLDNINKEGTYDSKEYGDVKDIKRWRKDKLIKWLLQFEIGVTKTNDESNNNENLDKKETTNKIDNNINLKETPEQKSIRELKEANDAANKAQEELKEALRKAEETSQAAAKAQKKIDDAN